MNPDSTVGPHQRTGSIVQSGRLTFDPARHDEALAALEHLAAESVKERGNLGYVWSADLRERGSFQLFEEWESHDALRRHADSEHGRALLAQLPLLGVQDSRLRLYEVIHAYDVALPD